MMQAWRMGALAGLAVMMAGPVWAEAPESSIRPKARLILVQPVSAVPIEVPAADLAAGPPTIRPRPRPAGFAAPVSDRTVVQTAMAPSPVAVPVVKKGLFGFLRPNKRPDGLSERKLVSAGGIRILPGKEAVVSKKGSVCGVPEIKGETLAPIPGKLQGCGIADPVRVSSIAGVKLSTAATVNCDTARALNTWVKQGVEPVYGRGKVVELKVFASYSCRGRNNKKGAKISEHGRGNAIDIGGLVLANGKTVTVLQNYDKPMRKVHKAACGIFGTTLGPGSDGYHENHLHLDVARYRNGTYCR